MKKTITALSILFPTLFVIFLTIYSYSGNQLCETLTIVFGVTSYHFLMRLSIGKITDKILHNDVDYTKKWFTQRPFEKSLYQIINVKKWKKYMPTYETDSFDLKKHSITEIIKAGCQAEIIHEIIMLFSFLPIILAICFQPITVFVITSVLSALFDGIFVIMQRYNRPRLLKISEGKRK